MKKKPLVVIPNWDGMPFILDCLAALGQQSEAHDVVVVDNGSKDDSVAQITQHYPGVIMIALPKNTGFAGGVNTGIRYGLEHEYDAVALLNNDAIPDKHWLKELVRTMESNPKAGIVTCKLLHTDGAYFDSTGDFYATCGIPFPRDRNQKDTGQRDQQESVFSATGGASLYRCAMFRQVGIFDEYFFAYYEDVDVSFRARLAGWDVIYQPASFCYHAISATSSRHGSFSRYHSIKNLPVLYYKNMPALLFWKYLPLFTYQLARQFASSTLKGLAWVHIKAVITSFRHLPTTLKDRRRIQKARVLSSAQVDALLVHTRPPRIPLRSSEPDTNTSQ